MIQIIIPGTPIPWCPSRSNRGKFYNPKDNEKKRTIWHIKSMNLDAQEGPLKLDIAFKMPIPSYYSKKKKESLIWTVTYHTKKPDRTNLLKFYEDCLELAGIIHNDSFVVAGEAIKIYSPFPSTEINITRLA